MTDELPDKKKRILMTLFPLLKKTLKKYIFLTNLKLLRDVVVALVSIPYFKG